MNVVAKANGCESVNHAYTLSIELQRSMNTEHVLAKRSKAIINDTAQKETFPFSFFGGSLFNRQTSVLVTIKQMPHIISSPADPAKLNMVKGIPIRQNMIVMPCPSRVFGVRFPNPEKTILSEINTKSTQ